MRNLHAKNGKRLGDEKIKDTYVKIEDNWIDCEFQHNGWLKIKK